MEISGGRILTCWYAEQRSSIEKIRVNLIGLKLGGSVGGLERKALSQTAHQCGDPKNVQEGVSWAIR